MGTRSDYYIRYADGHISHFASHSHDGYLFPRLIEGWLEWGEHTVEGFARLVYDMEGEMGSFYACFPWPWKERPELTDLSYLYDETSKRVLLYVLDGGYAIDFPTDGRDPSKWVKNPVKVLSDLPAPYLAPTIPGDVHFTPKRRLVRRLHAKSVLPAVEKDRPLVIIVR